MHRIHNNQKRRKLLREKMKIKIKPINIDDIVNREVGLLNEPEEGGMQCLIGVGMS